MSKIDIPEKLAIWQDDERQSKNTENTEKAFHYNYFFREQYALNKKYTKEYRFLNKKK
jgi:hypothetical protein